MNNYPSWWDSSVTVYNKNVDSVTNLVKWYRTVLTGCFWKNIGNKVKIGNNILESDDIVCRIPKQGNYLSPKPWKDLSNDTKDDYFTLQGGDIIVFGEVEDEINEYAQGQRASDLLKKYVSTGCLTITQVADNTGGGRGQEHYYVKGV